MSDSHSDPDYKLYYFPYRGMAEPIRLILTYCNVPFEDIRIERYTEFYKSWKSTTPMGQLPVLLDTKSGFKLCQSTVISRYLGEKYGLRVDDPLKRAVLEQWVASGFEDLCPYQVSVSFVDDPEHKKLLFKKMVEEFLKPRLAKFEEHLKTNGTTFLVTDTPLWGDFVVYNTFFMIIPLWFKIPLLDDYPRIKEYCKAIEALPRVKERLENYTGDAAEWSLGPHKMR